MKRGCFALALLLTFGATTSTFAQLSPQDGLKDLKVAPGLQVELFASEEQGFVNPTSIDVDHMGRVWVCEAVNYRRKLRGQPPLRKEGDRIVIVIDADGDGKADKSHTFYQAPEIMAPLGIAVAKDAEGPGYKVYVCQSPDILLFTDKDGDLVADGPPTKFLTGFGGIDHDHGVHGINIGPDGKLYFTVGDAGTTGMQSSDGKGRKWASNSTDVRAGTVWRCDLDGKNVELIAHNFRNNYEACVDSFGGVFLSDNDDDGNQQTRICFVMKGGNYGYHPRGPGQSHWHEEQPGVVHKIIRTGFGSPTGITMYEGNLLPEKYRGSILHTDAGPRELRAFHLKANGAGYDVEKELILTSVKDSWFRLADVCVAPDGSLICADWYDPGVGGHGMGDTTRGRIYRITPTNFKGYHSPKVDVTTKDGILAALKSPNLATRHIGHQKFLEMPDDEAISFIQEAWAKADKDTALKARIAWTTLHRSQNDPRRISKMLRELRADSTELALVAERFKQMYPSSIATLNKDGDHAEPWLDFLSKAPLSVAREVLLWLPSESVEKAKPLFYRLAKRYDGKDIFYRAALNIALGTDPERRRIILADFDKNFPAWNDTTADLVWELRPESVMPQLEKRLADAELSAAQRARIVDILAAGDTTAGQSMLRLLTTDVPTEVRDRILDNLRQFLPGKWSPLRNSDELSKVIDKLMSDPATQLNGLTLIGVADRNSDVARVQKLAADAKAENAVRVAAVKTLGRLPGDASIDALASLTAGKATPITAAAIEALGTLATVRKELQLITKAINILTSIVVSKDAPTESKKSAVSALSASQPGTTWLLDTHKKGELPTELVADTGRLLRNSPYQGLRNQAMLVFPPPGRLDPKKLPPIAELVKRKGDPKKGQSILAASLKGESQCMRCHMIRGGGGQIGPDLSMIGKKASRENMFESILAPSKAIADQYINWAIETKAGVVVTGLLIEETPEAVTIRDANGRDTKIVKKDIEDRQKTLVSIMPENLVAALTEDDVVDLVEYLLTMTTPSLSPDRWSIVGPFEAGSTPLETAFGPEKDGKIDLTASYPGKGGPVKWRTVRPGENGYVDLAAFFAPNNTEIVSYVVQDIESPVDQDATILLGTDDGGKLFVNGKSVWSESATRAAAPEQNRVTVKLKKGRNTIMLKIANGGIPHGFYFTIVSEQELKPMQIASK